MQAMSQPITVGLIVRRGLALSLLGFLLVVLAGPAAAVAGFAILGYVAYRGFRFLWFGEKPPEWSRVVEIGRTVFVSLFRVASWPIRKLWSGAKVAGRFVGGTLGFTWSLAGESLSGALLGAALGVAVGWPLQLDHVLVGLGAGGGALVGLWTALDHVRRERVMAARRAALESVMV